MGAIRAYQRSRIMDLAAAGDNNVIEVTFPTDRLVENLQIGNEESSAAVQFTFAIEWSLLIDGKSIWDHQDPDLGADRFRSWLGGFTRRKMFLYARSIVCRHILLVAANTDAPNIYTIRARLAFTARDPKPE